MQILDPAAVNGFPWLTLLVAIPVVGAILIGLIPPLRKLGRQIALFFALAELVVVVAAATQFDWTHPGSYQLIESHQWIPQIGATWSLGVNALGLVMLILAAALVVLVLIAAWHEDDITLLARRTAASGDGHEAENAAEDSTKEEQNALVAGRAGAYAALILVLEAFMMMIFAAFDVIVFYIAFEGMLIPLYFMIGSFGVVSTAERHRAAMKMLLFSLAGGLAMLGGLIVLWAHAGGSATLFRLDTAVQASTLFSHGWQLGIFWTFMTAFAIKAPMVPVHTWLPETAGAARPGTSVLLVGVLDKIGTFGMITLCLTMFPSAAASMKWVLCLFAVISILWGGLAAVGQKDLMRLVSYTSVSHFGFMVLGIFIGSSLALTGAMFYMVAHGLSIAAMFFISGFLTQRGGSRQIADYRGIQRVTPVIAGTWLVSGLASMAMPGLSGFVSEYLVLVGTLKVSTVLAIFAVLGVVIAAGYILWPYQKIFTGPKPEQKLPDMNGREKTVVVPLIAAMVILGLWSAPLVQSLTPVADNAVSVVTTLEGSAK